MGMRLISLALLIAAWYAGSQLAGARLLPDPQAVALAIVDEARSGALAFPPSATVTLVLLAAVWAILAPALSVLAMRLAAPATRISPGGAP